jgi:hypothetical protein
MVRTASGIGAYSEALRHTGLLPAGVRQQHRDRAGRHARPHRVGARGQDDRHARAEHDAGGVRVGQERELLGQHVAGLEVGHKEDVGLARDRRAELIAAASLLMALSKASGPSSTPPVI